MKAKVITFDVFGTLFDWRLSCRELLLQRTGIGYEEVERLLTVFREKQFFYMLMDNCLRKGRTSFRSLSKSAMEYALGELELEVDEGVMEEFLNIWGRLRPFDDALSTLREVKEKGYRTAMLSNGDAQTLKELAEQLGGTIDGIISSEEVGVYKPEPAIYLEATKKFGVAPSEVIHVAGSYMDVVGAASAGLKTFWINRGATKPDRYGPHPTRIFNRLSEMLAEI